MISRYEALRHSGPRPIFLFALFAVLMLLAGSASAQTAPVCTLDISAAVAVLFQVPADTNLLGQAFGLGFTVPISAYLVAYFVGLFVSMFDH